MLMLMKARNGDFLRKTMWSDGSEVQCRM